MRDALRPSEFTCDCVGSRRMALTSRYSEDMDSFGVLVHGLTLNLGKTGVRCCNVHTNHALSWREGYILCSIVVFNQTCCFLPVVIFGDLTTSNYTFGWK
ncbi:putative protein phosphatase 2C 21 [Zea mays]|uniref:Uncharacterized protein n=1 Tax=Zea mays TaxID=4577 RepID=A0A1D6P535_MAIZE|nr:putative protein phosphatase 2C 21 [Zea mays]